MADTLPEKPANVRFNFNKPVSDIADLAVQTRIIQAMEGGFAKYSHGNHSTIASRERLDNILNRLAEYGKWNAYRPSHQTLILDAGDFLVDLTGSEQRTYSTCGFFIYADSKAILERAHEHIVSIVGESRIVDPMFTVHWHFSSHETLNYASMDEVANETLLDEAYPEIAEGIQTFIDRYLDSSDPVLVLQGPPGSGKTKLIRAILGRMSQRKNKKTEAMSSNDMEALNRDELYVRFLTTTNDVFIVEDADHLLGPRLDGNELMQRFLTIADGIVRGQGRKIIFSTNLPNIGDLDDALVRPGRCFARLMMRALKPMEAEKLVRRLSDLQQRPADGALIRLHQSGKTSFSVAETYRILQLQSEPQSRQTLAA